MEQKKNLVLKKHIATIHSSNKLSLLQRKIANALLFNAYDELLSKEEHQINISALCNLIGYESNDHKTIKKALVNLLATVIEWNLMDENKAEVDSVWNASSIIADASIEGPVCTYSYSNKMKHLLYRPELYGRLNMLIQAKFKSSYGLALYENCIRFQGINYTPWFDLLKFRKLMGIEENKYKIFRDFKHRVLDKAIEEVNKYSSMIIKPIFKREGKKIIAIQFELKETSKNITQKTQMPLSEELQTKFHLSLRQAQEVMSSFEELYIREKISIIEQSQSYVKGKIKHIANYLMSALKENYQLPKTLEQKEDKIEIFKQKQIESAQIEAYHRYQNKEIINLFNKKNELEQKLLLPNFENFLGRGIYLEIFKRDGLNNILIRDQLCLYLRQFHHNELKSIMSFTDFQKKYLTKDPL